VSAACLVTLQLWAQAPPAAGGKPASQPATGPAAQTTADTRSAAQKSAEEYYHKVVDAYMTGAWKNLDELLKLRLRRQGQLTREQRADLAYVDKMADEHRPKWWKACMSTSNKSFRARIWGRSFTANYMPSEMLGVQAAVGIRRGKIMVIVSWRPNMVDNPRPLGGALAKRHELSKGNLGEVIVWHELGHNYITNFLPLRHVIELYNNHNLLFHHLQEFYADMTALYHCSPRSRRTALMFRLSAIDANREAECHTRGALTIGSVVLAEFLASPDDWPSVHFPPEVPAKDVERMTLIYVYENFDKNWTLAEDRALREVVSKLNHAQGERMLRKKGELALCNDLKVNVMEPSDREFKLQRDQWVADRLKALIASGRADKPAAGGAKSKSRCRIEIPF